MTTPDERRRTLVQAGAFLKELRGNQSLPEAVRQEAHRLLRHYPSLREIEHLARPRPSPPVPWRRSASPGRCTSHPYGSASSST